MNDVTRALAGAVTVAGRAPSIHNTQPWRFVVDGDRLDLHPERSRQLREVDPEGHMMLVSCGAARQHALVALAAEGWQTEVARTGEADGPVARVRVTGHGAPDPEAVRRLAA